MEQEKDKGPGVKVPPPIIFLFFILLGFGLDYVLPIAGLNWQIAYFCGWGLCIVSFVLAGGTAVLFLKEKTNIEPWKPDAKLIVSGFYRFSRNPIYLAFALFTLGLGLILSNLWVVLSVIPAVMALHRLVILKEEKYLASKFGQEYIAYCQKVRRWF